MAATARRFPAAEANLRDRVGRLEGGWDLLWRTLSEMREDRQRGEDRLAGMIAQHGEEARAGIAEVKDLVIGHAGRLATIEADAAKQAGADAAQDKATERWHASRRNLVAALIGLLGCLIIAGVTIWSVKR